MVDDSQVVRGAGPLAAQVSRLYGKALNEAVAPLGLAPAQFMVLRELWKAGSLTQSELARRLDVEQATMANTLKRMARDDLIVRDAHQSDGRAQLIRPAPRADALQDLAKAAARQVNARAVANLSRKEQKRFVDLSRRIVGSLKGDGRVSAPVADSDL